MSQWFGMVAAVLALAGIGYNLLCLWSARRFRGTAMAQGFAPPVTILKPLRGIDAAMYESFRSQCLQDYPDYELIFGVSDRDDPAAALVEHLMREFPERPIRLVVCPKAPGANGKVNSLAQMLPLARYEYLIVSDSDIRVPPNYLRRVLAPLADPQVGVVTCLYRSLAASTLGARLEALGISTDFAPGVLAARQLEGLSFGLGATLALPRRALDSIGGFEVLADYLGDDYELGHRIAEAGFQVRLSDVVVEHHLPAYSLREFWQHQLRWMRTIRDSRPWGYAGLAFTFALPWAIATVALAHGAAWSWALLAAALAVRFTVSLRIGARLMHDPQVGTLLWLIPVRDIVAAFVWIGGFAGHTIVWRGERFILDKGKLRRLETTASRRSPVAR